MLFAYHFKKKKWARRSSVNDHSFEENSFSGQNAFGRKRRANICAVVSKQKGRRSSDGFFLNHSHLCDDVDVGSPINVSQGLLDDIADENLRKYKVFSGFLIFLGFLIRFFELIMYFEHDLPFLPHLCLFKIWLKTVLLFGFMW